MKDHRTSEEKSLYEDIMGKPIPEGWREVEYCLGCGKEQPCPSDCPAGSGWWLEKKS
jgi:hypothetical protein